MGYLSLLSPSQTRKARPTCLRLLMQLMRWALRLAAARAGQGVTGAKTETVTESKMVALVIDPLVVGTELVAPVRPGEIPAFEPPAPAVSAQVPDYERVSRTALGAGSPGDGS